MTGSMLYRRLHSSTPCSTVKANERPKYRRYSSVDEAHPSDVALEEMPVCEEIRSKQRHATTSESDSGVEDLDQRVASDFRSQPNEVQDDDEVPTFGACPDDECLPAPIEPVDFQEQCYLRALNDLQLAARVPDAEKKEFCADTQLVFHAEFSQRISFPIADGWPNFRYHLFAEEEVAGYPFFRSYDAFCAVDNAKGQFHCPNPACGRSWTSMRSRIVFRVSQPQEYAYVVLKIFGQCCQDCGTPTEALWYMEEVCRVMKNLGNTIRQALFPSLPVDDEECKAQAIVKSSRSSRKPQFDPNQRQGHMRAQHDSTRCEACRSGYCFPQTADRLCT